MVYRPKIIEGKIKNTGWAIDGHILLLTSWDYDNHESWHLCDWKEESEKAVIETMFVTETEAGMCLCDTLEEFTESWGEWEPQGSFCIPLENVEVVNVIQEETINGLPVACDLKEAAEYICDNLCRFSHNKNFTQEELEGICDECNLGAVLGITEETKDTISTDPVSDHNDPWKRRIMERFTEVN